MKMSACLPAAPGKCSAHHRDELVLPLLLVVVRAAEELAGALVVCLRGGGWVSSVESWRALPAEWLPIIIARSYGKEVLSVGICFRGRSAGETSVT